MKEAICSLGQYFIYIIYIIAIYYLCNCFFLNSSKTISNIIQPTPSNVKICKCAHSLFWRQIEPMTPMTQCCCCTYMYYELALFTNIIEVITNIIELTHIQVVLPCVTLHPVEECSLEEIFS